MTSKNKKSTPTDDLKPSALTVGKWKIPPLNLNTTILLEKIGSPFMDENFDSNTSRYKDGRKISMQELVGSIYVLVNAEDPRIDDLVDDPVKFNRCVSAMAREITLPELGKITASINAQFTRVNQAVQDIGSEGDSPKKEIGPAS